jgi:hypothetical protein
MNKEYVLSRARQTANFVEKKIRICTYSGLDDDQIHKYFQKPRAYINLLIDKKASHSKELLYIII